MSRSTITLDSLTHSKGSMTVREHILSAIRSGVYPWVAAEAVGVSRQQFQAWLRSKDPAYRQFAVEVRGARGWARLQAEMALFKDDPRTWLKSGPGRELKGKPGWSKDVLPMIDPATQPPKNPLTDPAWRELFDKMLDALGPYPEARAALAQVLKPQEKDSI